jgi:hypothetical protein
VLVTESKNRMYNYTTSQVTTETRLPGRLRREFLEVFANFPIFADNKV